MPTNQMSNQVFTLRQSEGSNSRKTRRPLLSRGFEFRIDLFFAKYPRDSLKMACGLLELSSRKAPQVKIAHPGVGVTRSPNSDRAINRFMWTIRINHVGLCIE